MSSPAGSEHTDMHARTDGHTHACMLASTPCHNLQFIITSKAFLPCEESDTEQDANQKINLDIIFLIASSKISLCLNLFWEQPLPHCVPCCIFSFCLAPGFCGPTLFFRFKDSDSGFEKSRSSSVRLPRMNPVRHCSKPTFDTACHVRLEKKNYNNKKRPAL